MFSRNLLQTPHEIRAAMWTLQATAALFFTLSISDVTLKAQGIIKSAGSASDVFAFHFAAFLRIGR